jgi:hypothetical protein
VYLEICRRVTRKIKTALQAERDTSNCHLFQSCPACFYKLEDEPKLEYSCFLSFDGNNSLKRLGDKVRNQDSRADFRSLASPRWLTPAEVDRFKDEVKVCIFCFCFEGIYLSCAVFDSQEEKMTMMPMIGMMKTVMLMNAQKDGGMPLPKNVRGCLPYLMNQGYSLHHVAIGWFYWHVI